MSSPNELHINFGYKGITYNLHLVKGEKSDHSVEINGTTYAVLGSKEKLQTACEILNSILLDSITSSQDLQGRLSSLKGISFPASTKIEFVSKKTLINDLNKPSSKKTYINTLKEELNPLVPKGAGAVVAISQAGKEPEFVNLGSTSVNGGTPPNEDTVALIGSGAKMFTALLSKILEEKGIIVLEENKGLMQSKLSHFMKEEHFLMFENPEAAKNITLESLLSHTSGLQYFADDNNNSRKGQTLDSILNGIVKDVKSDPSRAVKFTNNPEDKIYSYSNQIGLVALCIEKAYKKALAADLINKKLLDKNQTLRELSPKLETFRNQLHEKIRKTEDDIKNMRQLGAFDDVIAPYEKRLATMKTDLQKLSIPDSAQDLTIQELMDCESAYTSPPNSLYIYDLIDPFLMQFEPEELASSKLNEITYADILKRELLQPLGMEKTSFQRPIDSNVLEACVIKEGATPKTIKEDILDPMMRGAGGLWSTPRDIMKLARSFSPSGNFLDKAKNSLISKQGVAELTKVRGINGKTGLAMDIEGPVIGKGGGISTYDFKFKLDTSTGNAMVSMCNFTGAEKKFKAFVTKATHSLEDLNPELKVNHNLDESPEIDTGYLEMQLNQADMEKCDEFFIGKQGYVGVKRTDFGIIVNWNGIRLPAKSSVNGFVIFGGGQHDGKEVLFKEGRGSSKTPYLFIEKGIDSAGFTKTSKEKVIIPQHLDFPKDVSGVDGIYKSPHPDGPKPINITATTNELLFAYGENEPVPGQIAKIIRDDKNEEITEIWVMTTAEDVPDKMYKLIKNKNDWSLAIAFFENPETNLENPIPRGSVKKSV